MPNPTPEEIQMMLGIHPDQVAANNAFIAGAQGDSSGFVGNNENPLADKYGRINTGDQPPAPRALSIEPPKTEGASEVRPSDEPDYQRPIISSPRGPSGLNIPMVGAPDATTGETSGQPAGGNMFNTPITTASQKQPSATDAARTKAEAELARERDTGSGVDQFSQRHHFWGPIVKGLSIAGSAIAPGVAAMIPGTDLHHRVLMADQQGIINQADNEDQKRAQNAETEARTAHETQQAAKIKHDMETPDAPTPDKAIHTYTNKDGNEVTIFQKPDSSTYEKVFGANAAKPTSPEADKLHTRELEQKLTGGTINDEERKDLASRQQEAKLQGAKPEIVAQVGRPPVPAQYPKGMSDPAYQAAEKKWGHDYETVLNREASASATARGDAFGAAKRMAVIDPRDGKLKIMSAGTAESIGASPASEGAKSMSKEAQFNEMHVAADHAKESINNLDRDFTPAQIAKLTLAFSHNDEGIIKNEIDSFVGTQQLTPAQEDFVIWINQLNERAMSLRNVAGMGAGAGDLRAAIRSTLPSLKSGSKEMALKQLDAFKNQVDLLQKGVPTINHPKADGATKSGTPTGQFHFVPDPS